MAGPADDYGAAAANRARETGQNALNSFDPTSFGNKIREGFGNLFAGQQQKQNSYIDAFKGQIMGQANLPETYAKLNEEYNVPALASNANTLNRLVLEAPTRALKNARGFNYGQNQVDKATARDLYYLTPQANAATQALQTAQGMVNTGVGFQQTQNQYELQPTLKQGEMMTELFAREASGFTTAAEAELNGLLEKMKSGIALSQAEFQRANELAQQQTSYQNTLNTAAAQNKYQTLNPAQTLVNTITGASYRAK